MSDIAFRYLRLRPGTNQPGENTGSHGMIIGTGEDIILDHVSFSWANDQLLSIYNYPHGWGAPGRITVQRSLFGEPLASSPVCYATKGNVEPGPDGIPDWYDVNDITFHHNAAIHCSHRARPLMSRTTEVINNVVYNWHQGAMHASCQDLCRLHRELFPGRSRDSTRNRFRLRVQPPVPIQPAGWVERDRTRRLCYC